MPYRINISITEPFMTFLLDDIWSCIVVLVLFWLIGGVHGSANLQLGPYSSHLIEINSVLVQSIKVEQNNKPKPGLMLYGFDHPPPLDIKINWTEIYDESIPAKSQKEWIFYLNKDSQLDIFYNVKSLGAPLFLVISNGRESLIEWKKDPSFPNATLLYWNNINGSDSITQKISHSSTYYVAIGNMNPQNVKVQLNFIVNALLYNTSGSYHRCSLDNGLCTLNPALSANIALLTTPGPRKGVSNNHEWFDVNVSYEPRWIIYFAGSGVVIVQILFALKFYKMLHTNNEENTGFQQVEVISERTPLISRKDSDLSSWSSAYDSFSSENSDEGKSMIEGETSNLQCLCVICFDVTRDCIFLPCGHFATCFACGKRVAEDTCTCPICRRKLKKLRRIYVV
ncbi:hypothetical protein P8452_25042 [Trifolium repens]|nr:hypothetical protein P8452_25042 [Trifolium repens]